MIGELSSEKQYSRQLFSPCDRLSNASLTSLLQFILHRCSVLHWPILSARRRQYSPPSFREVLVSLLRSASTPVATALLFQPCHQYCARNRLCSQHRHIVSLDLGTWSHNLCDQRSQGDHGVANWSRIAVLAVLTSAVAIIRSAMKWSVAYLFNDSRSRWGSAQRSHSVRTVRQ